MKRCLPLLLVCLLATPGWCARKVTVAQLQDLLRSLSQDKKQDVETAAALQQVELSEELTRDVMNHLMKDAHGPLTTEQLFVLEARSADLAPPVSDLPETPRPDESSQKAMLAKAETYVSGRYAQLPAFTARKTTLRFQDNTAALASSSGIASGAKDAATSSGLSNVPQFIHYINAVAETVVLDRGVEKGSTTKDRTRWGANGQIRISEPELNLPRVFSEVETPGTLRWTRWELIDGKPAAVFSFEVPRQQSRQEVKVCCFPQIRQAGIARFYTSTTGPILGAEGGGGGGGVAGNLQTNTDWNEFKSTVPYSGKLFIDPETGTVLRLIVEDELKPSDVVHQLETRIDYAPVKAAQGTFILPIRSFLNSVVVPNGESGAGGYSTRTTLFHSEYSEYHVAHLK